VTDEDGQTPTIEPWIPEAIDPSEIPELEYGSDVHSISHQPWRRGDTDGCEDPIEALWRVEAEEVIRRAASVVQARIVDITWYMAAVVITLDEDTISNAANMMLGEPGPEVRVQKSTPPQWHDPEAGPGGKLTDDYGWYEGEEDGRVVNEDGVEQPMDGDPYTEREFDEQTGTYLPPPERPMREAAVRNMSFEEHDKWLGEGMKLQMQDRDKRVKNKMTILEYEEALDNLRETTDLTDEEIHRKSKHLRARYLKSEDLSEYYPEEFEKVGLEEAEDKYAMPALERIDGVDTNSLSIIAKAITDALEDEDIEERLEVLSRHEIILTSQGDEDYYVETQRQFDERRGQTVIVQTQDPFGSNRALEGQLIDRNALDVMINVEGRMVTIPMNMIAYVQIAD